MFRRNPKTIAVPTIFMDSEIVGSLEDASPPTENDFIVRAVIFGSGEIRRANRNVEIYGLVLAGYQGIAFGDDGTYTGLVASELPLDEMGIRKVEAIIDDEVQRINPGYCAEHVGYIALDEAAVKLEVEIKREMGVAVPKDVRWSTGSLHNIS